MKGSSRNPSAFIRVYQRFQTALDSVHRPIRSPLAYQFGELQERRHIELLGPHIFGELHLGHHLIDLSLVEDSLHRRDDVRSEELTAMEENRLGELMEVAEIGDGRAALEIDYRLHYRRVDLWLGPEDRRRHDADDLDVCLALEPGAQGTV